VNRKTGQRAARLRRRVGTDDARRSTRRALLIALGVGAFGTPLVSLAQQSKIYRVGILGASTQAAQANLFRTFESAMRELGYVEGSNVIYDRRFADGNNERLSALAAELGRTKPDVIFAAVTPAALAAKREAKGVPVVFANSTDPVAVGLISSLAHPGGVVTGFSSSNEDITPKRLELIRELSPKALRIALLMHPDNEPDKVQIKILQRVAQALGITIIRVEARNAGQLENSLSKFDRQRLDGMIVVPNPVNTSSRQQIISFARTWRRPVLFGETEAVEAGGLISYTVSWSEQFRRAAGLVDRILKGTKPADIPVEQPTRFELAINVKTAKALGIKIPQTILVRADKVIE
jgi:ABC-type uncharacterized transport system substrate-binding protein